MRVTIPRSSLAAVASGASAAQLEASSSSVSTPSSTADATRDAGAAPEAGAPPPPVLRLRGGKGGFGSNLRAAGKHKLTDNFDACRDLQGRRIRHKTAAQKLQEWQAGAQERELEKIAAKEAKAAAQAERRTKEMEVDMTGERAQAAATLAGVTDAVRFAVRTQQRNGAPASAADGGGGQKAQRPAAQPRRQIDPLLLGSDDDEDDADSGSDGDPGGGGSQGGAGVGADGGGVQANKEPQFKDDKEREGEGAGSGD